MGRSRSLLRLALLASALAPNFAVTRPIDAQEPEIPTVRGAITAVEPDGFDVAGYHIVLSKNTLFFPLNGPKKSPSELRNNLAPGTYVHVIGDKENSTHTVAARQVKIRNDSDRLSGLSVIDRMYTRGAQPVFRADGYTFRLTPDTEINFGGDIDALTDVDTGTWVRYEGARNSSGEMIPTSVKFIKPKPHKLKENLAKLAQATDFPPGSRIGLDGSFEIKSVPDKTDDTPGGECGWYPVPDVPAVQEHIRRVGIKLVPQYQRDLPDDDPAKIRFRFYLVDEKNIRSALSCHEGLVLIPVRVVNRLRSEDQLAAVLADGIAATLQRQQARISTDAGIATAVETAALLAAGAAAYGAAYIGVEIRKHEIARKMEEQRGRVALALMADAGYDPWQAPEAWRLLGPEKLPKDPAKLKYPDRAGYQLGILGKQYKPATESTASASQTANAPSKQN